MRILYRQPATGMQTIFIYIIAGSFCFRGEVFETRDSLIEFGNNMYTGCIEFLYTYIHQRD